MDKKEANTLTVDYQVFVPQEVLACDDIVKYKPLQFTGPTGIFSLCIKEHKQRKIGAFPEYVLQVNVITDVKSVEECELIEQVESDIENLVYRFFRLLRHKIPNIPFNLPKDLLSAVQYNWEKPKPHWHIMGMREIPVKVSRQDTIITVEQWIEIEKELASDVDTEIWEDFLLDAKVALRENDMHKATLYAAIACETFIKYQIRLMAPIQKISNKFIKFIDGQEPDIRTLRYYGPILHLVSGRSLEDEESELYKSLERIMRKRNKIMHEGKRLFNKDECAQLVFDIGNMEKAISWVLNSSKETSS